ncbi:hypothetical protein ACF09E_11840 [Streptomyces sp. NPDC014891]|uniref:hypothetical protein n=1 Tax=Streptomyces sp. NPDC014891 TaxID=3364929 RepID=UPI0036FF7103
MDDVATRALPLPDDVAGLLHTLRERLDELVDEEPVMVLKAAENLGRSLPNSGRSPPGTSRSTPSRCPASPRPSARRRKPPDPA